MLTPIWVFLDNVAVFILVLARIPDVAAGDFVQFFYGCLRNSKLRGLLVDKLESVSIAAHLFFVAVAQK